MRKYNLSFVLFFLMLFPLFGWAENAATSLEATLANIKTLQADFTEVILTGKQVNQRLSGTFYLKKIGNNQPGKFLWQTKKPIHQEIIFDGRQLWIYDKDLEQVTITSLQRNVGGTPVLLLNGKTGNIGRNYTVKLASDSANPHTRLYTLMPKQKTLYRFIQMFFDGESLVRMRFEDNLGQFTDFTFTHIKLNQPLTDKPFVFHPPKHVDIIHE
jgi:outer membrane lipoprotein carrier protein